MSIRNSIANCRKRIGSGMDRVAYYSPKYNLVFKKIRHYDDFDIKDDWGQSEKEIEFFKMMNDSDKEVFPMVGYEYVNGEPVILMKKCTPVLKINRNLERLVSDDDDEFILDVGDIVGANDYSIRRVMFFIDDYNCHDIHLGNLAVDADNNLVIIDMGL